MKGEALPAQHCRGDLWSQHPAQPRLPRACRAQGMKAPSPRVSVAEPYRPQLAPGVRHVLKRWRK